MVQYKNTHIRYLLKYGLVTPGHKGAKVARSQEDLSKAAMKLSRSHGEIARDVRAVLYKAKEKGVAIEEITHVAVHFFVWHKICDSGYVHSQN